MEQKEIQELALKFVATKTSRDFKPLYDRLKPGLLIYVYNILKNQAASEDVVADSFIKMWAKIDQYDKYWNFSTWAYRITRNEAMQWIRKNGKTYSLEALGGENIADRVILSDAVAQDNGLDLVENPDWFFDEEEHPQTTLYNKVVEELQALSPLYKEIMHDREINDMKYEEISAKHNIELNTVKTRIARARAKIQLAAVTAMNDLGIDTFRIPKDKKTKKSVESVETND